VLSDVTYVIGSESAPTAFCFFLFIFAIRQRRHAALRWFLEFHSRPPPLPTPFGTHLAAHALTPSAVFLLRLLPFPDDVVEFCLRLLRFNNKSFVVPLFSLFFQKFLTLFSLSFSSSSPLFSLFFHSLYTIHYIYTLYLYTISIHIHSPSSLLSL
jgi:hypothetical protein